MLLSPLTHPGQSQNEKLVQLKKMVKKVTTHQMFKNTFSGGLHPIMSKIPLLLLIIIRAINNSSSLVVAVAMAATKSNTTTNSKNDDKYILVQ